MVGKTIVAGAVAVAAMIVGGEASGCAYMARLAEVPAEAVQLRAELEVARQVSDDPLAYRVQGVDGFSQTCLACHGGSVLSGWGIRFNHSEGGAGGAHRIGTSYVWLAAKGSALREPEMLDGRVVLVDGRVGCFSCHNPFNTEGKHLTIENNGSALCLSCHLK